MNLRWAYVLMAVPWLTDFLEVGRLPSRPGELITESVISALIGFSVWLLCRRAEREVASREELLSVASHELRTPLTGLRLQLQILERMAAVPDGGGSDREKIREALDICSAESRRLVHLVNALLDDTRLSNGTFSLVLEPQDFVDIVRGTIVQLRRERPDPPIALALEAEGPIPGCWDRLRMEQVVTNVLSNAVKYGEGKPITVRVKRNGKTLELSVRDEGRGIAPAFLPKLFRRFERAVATPGEGMGLGLYIAKQVVLAHGGSMTVATRPGAGSTFTVVLPIRQDCAAEVTA